MKIITSYNSIHNYAIYKSVQESCMLYNALIITYNTLAHKAVCSDGTTFLESLQTIHSSDEMSSAHNHASHTYASYGVILLMHLVRDV